MVNSRGTATPAATIMNLIKTDRIQVLYIDADAGYAKVLRQCLKMHGSFEVDFASSVEAGREKIRTKTYEAIVSDCVLPGKESLELVKELRERGSNIPFILFTATDLEQIETEALKAGINAYIDKYGDPEVAFSKLSSILKQLVERRKQKPGESNK